jgi:hypothetical protein
MTRNDTIAFLTCVLPPEGYYCAVIFNVAKPKPGVDFPRQIFCKSIEELADVLLAQDARGCTVYHACASFRTTGSRKGANAFGARSLWIDVDAGPGKAYPDAQAAAVAVVEFCRRVHLPVPLFVGSGFGIHCYWPLDETLDPDTWQLYASGLKSLCAREGLLVDPARTADIASILRTPGTHNRKEGEQLVQYDPCNTKQHAIETFASLRSHAVRTMGRGLQRDRAPINGTSIIGRLWSEPSYDTVYADQVADGCLQLDQLRRSGNLPEPIWYACLGVLAFCADGGVKAHEWSAHDYPRYSVSETAAKFIRARSLTGATTCYKFYDLEPSTCAACPLYGKINSPISVPVQAPEVRISTSRELIPDNDPLPDLPAFFKWTPTNQLSVPIEDDKGEPVYKMMCEHPVYLNGVQTAELDRGVFNYRFKKFLPLEGWSDVLIDARMLHGGTGIAEMFGKGAVINDAKSFISYARDAVNEFHKLEETHLRYDQFGWKNSDTSFLYGKVLYTAVGPVTAIGAKEVETRSQWIGPKKGGDVRAWTDAADSLFASDMEAYSTIVLASFAAPLMRFQSTDEGGAILHLFTPGSGMGKTTALTGAWTVWGTKEGLSLTNEDTRVSKPIAIGTLGNLPVIYDELRDKDPEYIRRMVVMFTEGRDRMRGMVDGTIRHQKANWQTIMLSAANNSLLDQLQGDGVDAPSFRVLELSSELPPSIDKTKGDRLKRILTDNSGHAGDAYLRYLLDPEVLRFTRAALEKWTQDIYDMTGVGSAFRFRVRAIGAIAVAAKIVNHLGILHFQVDRIIDWLINDLSNAKNAGTVTSSTPVEYAISALGEFINEHFGETLVVRDRYHRGKQVGVIQKPNNRLSIRYEIETKRVYISQSIFSDWAGKRQTSARLVLDALEKAQVVINRKRPITLSAGTDIPGAQVVCIEADAEHPAMGGLLATVTDLAERHDSILQRN